MRMVWLSAGSMTWLEAAGGEMVIIGVFLAFRIINPELLLENELAIGLCPCPLTNYKYQLY